MVRRYRKRNICNRRRNRQQKVDQGKKHVEKRWKGANERERKPVGRRWSVGTISADACSYAVRVLLSRAEIPAGFLRSLSSRAAFAERWNGGRQRCRKKERNEKKEEGQKGGKRGEKRRMRKAEPVLLGAWASHDIHSAQELWSRPVGDIPVGYISREYVDGGAHRVMGKYWIVLRHGAARRP